MKLPRTFAAALCSAFAAGAMAGQGLSRAPSDDAGYPGFFAGVRTVDLQRNGVLLADGSVTIPAGSQTAEADVVHKSMCEALGGEDFTDAGEMTLGQGTLDAAICRGEVKPLTPAPTVVPVPGRPTQRLYYPIGLPVLAHSAAFLPMAPVGAPSRILAYATVGSAPRHLDYVAVAGAEILGASGYMGYSISASVHADAPCEWRASGILPAIGDLRLFGYALCSASAGGDDAVTEVVACLGDGCRTDKGSVRYYAYD